MNTSSNSSYARNENIRIFLGFEFAATEVKIHSLCRHGNVERKKLKKKYMKECRYLWLQCRIPLPALTYLQSLRGSFDEFSLIWHDFQKSRVDEFFCGSKFDRHRIHNRYISVDHIFINESTANMIQVATCIKQKVYKTIQC